MTGPPGVFTVSLDTELAWGCFDIHNIGEFAPAYDGTREVVGDLVAIFDQYEIPATWAFVAHLFDECSGHYGPAPQFNWIDDWFESLPCQTGIQRRYWYAPDVLETVRGADVDHDIGLHGYTHMILGDDGCSRETAAAEVAAAMTAAESVGIQPRSFVYPRNRVGHRGVLREFGVEVYRGRDARWYESSKVPSSAQRGLRFAEEFAGTTPPTVVPRERNGLLEVPGSQVFRPYHGGWEYTPNASRASRATKGLERAATTGQIFHLWFHPFNLALERGVIIDELEVILARASELRSEGSLEIHPMNDIVKLYRDGRWHKERAIHVVG